MRRPRQLPTARASHRHLSHHALLLDGRTRRRMVRGRAGITSGATCPRSSRYGRKLALPAGPRHLAGRRAVGDVHRVAGTAADDPQHVQDCGELTPFTMHVAAHGGNTPCQSSGITPTSWRAGRRASRCSGRHRFCRKRTISPPSRAATLENACRSLHFFDGFRTSHEVSKIAPLSDDDLRALMPADAKAAHVHRALTPDHPVLRGTAQNPDAFFQAREAGNLYYARCPEILEGVMARFAQLTAGTIDCSSMPALPMPTASSSSWGQVRRPRRKQSMR